MTRCAATPWTRPSSCGRVGPAPDRSPCARPVIGGTRTVLSRAGQARATRPCGPLDAGISRALKGGSIIAIGSGRIARAAA